MADQVQETVQGDGYAVSSLDAMGDGPGFRKVRKEVGVTAFGINAIVLPEGYVTGRHLHEEQEEVYIVHRGRIEMEFGDGSKHVLGEGGVARVDASTIRRTANVGEGEAIVIVAGGKDGYVGRDGKL
ncbi:MAG TPA: cupin domain-containing protein, partial [Gemmatimonadaceae bacterium]|nr:cupin domain-containing protein [Gemmatimonadaceae bacterium]